MKQHLIINNLNLCVPFAVRDQVETLVINQSILLDILLLDTQLFPNINPKMKINFCKDTIAQMNNHSIEFSILFKI